MSIKAFIMNMLTFGAYQRIEELKSQIAALEDYVVEMEME